MDKNKLLETLQTIKNNYALAQAGIALMVLPDAKKELELALSFIKENEESSTFDYVTYLFEDDNLLRHSTNEFRNSALRNSLKETFELISSYASDNKCVPTLMKAPWYQFLRMLRNCLSHDFILMFNKSDLKHLPIRWSGLEIDKHMAKNNIPMNGFLSRQKSIELIDEVMAYVNKEFA